MIASAGAEYGDGSWLGTLRGKFPIKNGMFVATDDGLCRLEIDNENICVGAAFPGTEHFVDSGVGLFANNAGVIVTRPQQTATLRMTR